MAEQPINHERTPQAKRPAGRGRGLAFQLAALLLTAVSALAGTGLARWLRAPAGAQPGEDPAPPTGLAALFKGWPRPDLALVLTGQEHGYLLPCGCSYPQIGGLERRYNFLQTLRREGWRYVAVDLGDVPQKQGPVRLPNHQGRIKYLYAMRARKAMGYTAVAFGEYETHLGLLDVVAAEWGLNEAPPPVVNANLLNRDKLFPGLEKGWESADPLGGALKVGVASAISPAVKDRIKDRTVKDNLGRSDKALDAVLAEMDRQKVGLRVLLYQGHLGRGAPKPAEAVACAQAYPQFPVIVCLSEEAEDNAPANPVTVTTRSGSKSLVIKVGLKGKWVGVVGVYRTGKPDHPFEFRYQPVEMTPAYVTPKGREKDHPILKLMEQYTAELRGDPRRFPGGDYLAKYGQTKHLLQAMAPVKGLRNPGKAGDPTYVGSEACKRCHDHAYAVWWKSPHRHAYKTLVDAKKPSNRQYDPECVVCHTVGFGYEGGFRDAVRTPKLKDVGCESCHGPASLHVLNPTNEEWQKRLNPWKYMPASKRALATDQFCQTCHDIDNDVTWIHDGGFKTKWPKIAHPTPKPADD